MLRLLLPAVLALTSCAIEQPSIPVDRFRAGDLAAVESTAQAELSDGAPQNEAIVRNVLGQCAMFSGRLADARRDFAWAYQIMGTWAVGGSEVYKALFGDESSKTYRGDPYERSMNAFYLALADLWSGEPDNARACMINGIMADAESGDEKYQADNALLFWMKGRMGHLSGSSDVREDFADARKANEFALAKGARGSTANPVLEHPDRGNLVVLAECGWGPEKYSDGMADQIARFRTRPDRVDRAVVSVDGQVIGETAILTDVNYQATTRGGTAMEGVRNGKAILKAGLAITGVEVMKSAMHDRDVQRGAAKATAAGVFILLAWLISADADARHWPTLPSTVQAVTADVAPGRHRLRVDFLDATGVPLGGLHQEAEIVVPTAGEAWFLVRSLAKSAVVGPGLFSPPTAVQPSGEVSR